MARRNTLSKDEILTYEDLHVNFNCHR